MVFCRVCGVMSEQSAQFESMKKYINIYLQVTAVQFHEHEDRQLLKICPLCVRNLQSIKEFRKECLIVHWEMFKMKSEPENNEDFFEDSRIEVVAVTEVATSEPIPEEIIMQPSKKQRTKSTPRNQLRQQQLKCDRCPDTFLDIIQLKAHKRAHDGLLPFLCEICNVDFSSLLDMQLHNVENHTESLRFPCPECSEVFPSNQALTSHRQKVHNPNYVEPKPPSVFICEVCANAYTTHQSLKRHLRSHNPDGSSTVCDFSPRKFPTSQALKLHVNRHMPPLKLACTPTEPDKPKSSRWKRMVRKQNRNSGKAYVSSTNVLVPGKSFQDNFNCGCPKKCPSLFSSQSAVQDFFNSYWNLADWHKQNVLLRELVKSVNILRRCSKVGDQSVRSRTLHYFIPDGTDKVRVCKNYFLGVLQVGFGRVYRRVVEALKGSRALTG